MATVEAADVDAANRVLEALGLPMRIGAMRTESTCELPALGPAGWPLQYGAGETTARMLMYCPHCGGRDYKPDVSITPPSPNATDYPETNTVMMGRCEDCGCDLSLRFIGTPWDECYMGKDIEGMRGVQVEAAIAEWRVDERDEPSAGNDNGDSASLVR